jgi:uncharacterized membrane protein YkoI
LKKVLLTTGLSLALLAGGALATQAVGLPIAKAATATTTVEQADATEAPGTEVNDATEAKGTEVKDATEAPGTEVNDATEASGTEVKDATEAPGTEVKDATEAKDPNEKELTPAELQAQAKITAEQGKTAALQKVSGTVQSVALEDENGKAVYNVVVKDSASKLQEVIVDAQTGVVVKVDSPDAKDQNEGADTETADDNK